VNGAKFMGLSMSIKFEGKPPFYLGIAEVASAHALDGSVVLRATISVPELRPKSVPVQFILAIDVAKALAEQLPSRENGRASKASRRLVPLHSGMTLCFGAHGWKRVEDRRGPFWRGLFWL
jgi:hypothetical protein